jgi:hypothetical protein
MTISQVSSIDGLESLPRWDDLSIEAIDEFCHRLAAAVVLQAVLDAAGGACEREKHKQDAIAWLSDPGNDDTWFLLAGVTRRHVLNWIQAGCKKDQPLKKGTGHKHKLHYSNFELKTDIREKAQLPLVDPDLSLEY